MSPDGNFALPYFTGIILPSISWIFIMKRRSFPADHPDMRRMVLLISFLSSGRPARRCGFFSRKRPRALVDSGR